MNDKQIRELTDWLAVNVMGWELRDEQVEHCSWYDSKGKWVCFSLSWNPVEDANDCKMLVDQIITDGYSVSVHRTKNTSLAHVLREDCYDGRDPNELLATCIAARKAKEAEMKG